MFFRRPGRVNNGSLQHFHIPALPKNIPSRLTAIRTIMNREIDSPKHSFSLSDT